MVKEEWSLSIYNKAFDIINHKFYWKKFILLDFQQLNHSFSWFELYLCLPVFKWVSKINCCKYQLWSSATIDRDFLAGGVPPLAKNLLIPPPGKILPQGDSKEKWTWGQKKNFCNWSCLDIYYTLCPSVISFDKNLSYQQINKPNWHISLQ